MNASPPQKPDVEKVITHIIEPLGSLWGMNLDAYGIRACYEEFSRYDSEILQSAMRNLRRNSKRRPTLADIIAECEKAGDMRADVRPTSNFKRHLTMVEVDATMRGPMGRRAFAEGWWWPLYQHLRHAANSTYITDEQIDALQSIAERCSDDAKLEADIGKAQPMFQVPFRKLWETMKERRAVVWLTYQGTMTTYPRF